MNVRDAILQKLNDRIMRMRTALERFDNDTAEQTMVGPKWNVRDLVGHFVFWTGEGAEQIRLLAKGEPGNEYGPDDVINDEVFRRYRRMMYGMLLPQLRSAEERFLESVRALPPDTLGPDHPVRQSVDSFGVAHYDHHWPSLKRVAQ